MRTITRALSLLLLLAVAPAQAKFYTLENLPESPAAFRRAYDAAVRLDVLDGAGDHCSAVVVSGDGYVLTNLHCVKQCLEEAGFLEKSAEQFSGANYSILHIRDQRPADLVCPSLYWQDRDGNPHLNGRIEWLGRGNNTFLDPEVETISEPVFKKILENNDDFALLKFDLPEPAACVPLARGAAAPGDRVWNIGYPGFTMRYDGFDSTGYKKHISLGTVTGDVRSDSYLSGVIRTEEQWRREEAAYGAPAVLLSTTDSMHGSSGSMTINAAGELVALHYSATSPSALRMTDDLGANALSLRAAAIAAELEAGLGAEITAKIFSCPR